MHRIDSKAEDVASEWLRRAGVADAALAARSVSRWVAHALRKERPSALIDQHLVAFGASRRAAGAAAEDVVADLDRLLESLESLASGVSPDSGDSDAAASGRTLAAHWARYRRAALGEFGSRAVAEASAADTLERLARAVRHELRNRLNPLSLQLELMRMALRKGDAAPIDAITRFDEALRTLETVPEHALRVAGTTALDPSVEAVPIREILDRLSAESIDGGRIEIAGAPLGVELPVRAGTALIGGAVNAVAVRGAGSSADPIRVACGADVGAGRSTRWTLTITGVDEPWDEPPLESADPDFALARRVADRLGVELAVADGSIRLAGAGETGRAS